MVKPFMLNEQAVEVAINGSGLCDKSRVLGINQMTVISTLKSKGGGRLIKMNPKFQSLPLEADNQIRAWEEAEMDEQWAYAPKVLW